MRVTLLGVLGFVAFVALLGYVLYELQQTSPRNEPPKQKPKPNLPPETL